MSFARLSDRAILASQFSTNISSRERSEIENSFFDFLQQADSLASSSRKTKPVSSLGGKLYLLVDQSNKYLFCTCINDTLYPERAAFQLLEEFSSSVLNFQDPSVSLESAAIESLTRVFKKDMRLLMSKFDSPGNVDKTAQVREKVDQVQSVMQDNVKKMLDNHSNLEGLEEKTDSMSKQANQFLKQSVDLRRQMQMKNLKLKIVLGVVITLIVVWLLSSLFGKSS
jgi:Synaptobrevin